MSSYEEMLEILEQHNISLAADTKFEKMISKALERVTCKSSSEIVLVERTAAQLGTFDGEPLFVDDTPVFAYLRRGSKSPNPKFHFTHCSAFKKHSVSKYFCSTRSDGLFDMDLEDKKGNLTATKPRFLKACVECTGNYLGLSSNDDFEKRKTRAETLTPSEIKKETDTTFNKHAWFSKLYAHTDKKWSDISYQVRKDSNWTCEDCGLEVGYENKAFLHTHHINHDRNHNHKDNLKAVCIACHSNYQNHEDLRHTKQYEEFIAIYHKD